ncbi:MAG TPA: VWA domain-containing protein [Terriglobales bacterium]|nr:VWA domain-containing protein [Terriglobales bacterium]
MTGKAAHEAASRSLIIPLFIAVLLLITGVPAFAQSPSPGSPTRIVSRSQLVLVPVIVRDKSGHPEKGLTKQDFIVQEDGNQRSLAFVEEVSTSNAPISRPASTDEFTNVQPANTAPRRLVIMVFDRINTPVFDQNYARYHMGKYHSSSISDNALVALVTMDMGAVSVVHDFTDDRDALMAELAKLRSAPDYGANGTEGQLDKFGGPDVPIIQDFISQQGKFREAEKAALSHLSIRRTLDALEQLARAYSGVPGRKALVWITASFPFSVNTAGRLLGTSQRDARDSLTELIPIYERVWQVLNDANMSIYTVDARGLVANSSQMYQARTYTAGDFRSWKAAVDRWREEELMFGDSIASLRSFAEMTGGKAYVNTNDLTSGFRDAADDSSHYYMLGYYLDSKDMKAGWRNLKVRPRKEGLEVRARKGFFVNSKRDDSKDEVELALTSPLQMTEVPLTVRWTEQKRLPQSQEVHAGFTVTLLPEGITVDEASGNRMGFEALAIAVAPGGKPAADVAHKAETRLTAQQFESIRKQGATYNDFLKLQPGSYTVRFVIRDLVSGRIGSVIAPLTISGTHGQQ